MKNWFKTYSKEIYLSMLVILVGGASFGLGRISSIKDTQSPVVIENIPTITQAAVSVSEQKINATTTQSHTGNFVAARGGTVYYALFCLGVNRIKEENKIWFQTEAEAKRFGYKPASNCHGMGN